MLKGGVSLQGLGTKAFLHGTVSDFRKANKKRPKLQNAYHTSLLKNVLLALIVMELMWPIIRFLKRKPFSLNPFLYIGIISSTRRILMIEAEHSMLTSLGNHAKEWPDLWPVLAELGANVGIILVLAFALWLMSPPAPTNEKQDSAK